MKFDIIKNIINNNNDKILIEHSESKYEVRRKWMSHTKNEDFIYPCIYSIDKNNNPSLKWSKINDKGHFEVSKFIFSNGSGFICDYIGKYGLTQWASGICDNNKNLDKIKECFETKEFKKIIKSIQLDSSSYNIKVMKLFKKDFYNDFIK